MFIQTESTPNPATLKFLPGCAVTGEGGADFPSRETASRSPLAEALFEIDGVSALYFGPDFITVTKSDAEWQHLKPQILGVIMEHFQMQRPVMQAGAGGAVAPDGHAEHDGADGEIVDQIKELLDTRVRPAVAQDGGDITFDHYDNGIVYLHMRGSCSGCPSSTQTLKVGIERMLKHYIPEISEVRPV